jgi:pectate lyase
MRVRRPASRLSALVTVTVGLCAGAVVVATSADAAAGCEATYAVAAQWQGGFTAEVSVRNLGDAVDGWRATWSFTAGQQVTSGWNAAVTQSGSQVGATNLDWNRRLETGGGASFGFQGTWTGGNPVPGTLALNGVACTLNGGGAAPSAGSPSSRPPASSPAGSPSSRPPASSGAGGPIGWAAQNGGTTGGGNAATTTVSTAATLTSALGSGAAAVVRVSGAISCSGMLRVRSNKTIVGNPGATIVGCGFTVDGDRNVIIRNLTFRGWDDDAVNVESGATNIWVDHNSFGVGYDGAVDIKRGSDFVTVSWNRVSGHDKVMLLGHSDDNGAQDIGHLRVTYHHNWFDDSRQRHPRVRFANPVHVFNNYYGNVGGYGVASTMNAGVLVEANYFENTPDPFHRGEADSGPGSLVARGNYFVDSGSGQAGGSVAAIPYSYTADPAAAVKSIVTAGAGAGRITV